MQQRWATRGATAIAATVLLASCGATSIDTLPSEPSVVATDYVTLPPPTTTIPPTTTAPLEAGDVIPGESTYVVAEGDYPFVVADRFQVDFDAMIELNGWTVDNGEVPDWPPVGTTIRIPAGATVPDDPQEASRLVPVPTTSTLVPPESTTPTTPAPTTTIDPCVYTVVDGDYPTKVAETLGVTVDQLDRANAKTKGYDAFYVGLEIRIPNC